MADISKMIDDLIEGAERAGAKIERQCSLGREEKLAFDISALLQNPAVARSLVGAGLGGIGGALSSGEGHHGRGALQGALAGGGLSAAAEHPAIQKMLMDKLPLALANHSGVGFPLAIASGLGIPMGVGALAGSLGTHDQSGALPAAAMEGAKAAFDRFGVKQAFLGALAPLAGAVAGPSLARGALSRLSPRMAAGLGQSLKGQAFDMAAGAAGQAIGGRLGGQPQG